MKAKGRRLQDKVRNRLREIGTPYGLLPDDTKSAVMGEPGLDTKFSPAAARLFKLAVECKAVESLNVFKTFSDHYAKYEKSGSVPILVHTKNRSLTLVTLTLDDFMTMFVKTLPAPPPPTPEDAQ